MSKHLQFLIKKLLYLSFLLFGNSVFSEENIIEQNKIETHFSGFATTTLFSDKNWFDNTANLAVNFDISYEDWAIRGQVATGYENKLRRLAIEKTFFIRPRQEILIQLGRSPRLKSFYNPINDAPGTTGMAMLPLGGYRHRMVENSTFNSIDGIRAIYSYKTNEGIVKLETDYGILPLENQCGIQAEAAFSKCRDGYDFKPTTGAFDIGLSYETGPWTLHTYYGKTKLKTVLNNPLDKTSVQLFSAFNNIEFDVTMFGIQYSKEKWLFQTEYFNSKYNAAQPNEDFKTISKLSNYYILGSYNWTDQISTYASFSTSMWNGERSNIDRAIGATYVRNNTTVSLEYHNGEGYGWQKFFSTAPGWNSFVLSVTQRF